MRAEAKGNRTVVARVMTYQPNALPLGQTGSRSLLTRSTCGAFSAGVSFNTIQHPQGRAVQRVT